MGIKGVIVPNTQDLFVIEGAGYDPAKPACGLVYLPVLALELKDNGPPVPYTPAGWPKKPYVLMALLDQSSITGNLFFAIDGTSGDRFNSINEWMGNKIEGYSRTTAPDGEAAGWTVQADGKAELQSETSPEEPLEISTALSDLNLPKKLVVQLKRKGVVTLSDLSQYKLAAMKGKGLGTVFSAKSEKRLTQALHAVNLDWAGETQDDPDRSTGRDLDTDNKGEDKSPVGLGLSAFAMPSSVRTDWAGKTQDDPDRSTGSKTDTDNKGEDTSPVDLEDLL